MKIITKRKFLNRIERETDLYTDTEEIYFESPDFKIKDQELRNRVIEYAQDIGLSENFDIPDKKLNYISKEGQGYKLTLLSVAGRTKIKLEYTANFSDKINLPDEVKAEHQRKFLNSFPESKPRIVRLDLASEYVVKDKYWLDGIDKTFNCPFIKNNKVRYLRNSMQFPKVKSIGNNDQFTVGREKAMTHFTALTRSAMDKNYDKTASMTRMYYQKKITDFQFENFIDKWGMTDCGTRVKRVFKNEMVLRSESLKEASLLLTTARQQSKSQEEIDKIKVQIKAHWGSEHRLIKVDTIKNDNLYKAETCEVFSHIYQLDKKQSSKKEMIKKIAIKNKINEDSLRKIIQYPSKKRTIESCLKSLAREIKIENRGKEENIFDFINIYIPMRLRELVLELTQLEFRNYYDYYNQKALLAINSKEKEFYLSKAEEIKKRGFLYHDMSLQFYKGPDGEKVKDWSDDIEKSLMETQLTEKELKALDNLKA